MLKLAPCRCLMRTCAVFTLFASQRRGARGRGLDFAPLEKFWSLLPQSLSFQPRGNYILCQGFHDVVGELVWW